MTPEARKVLEVLAEGTADTRLRKAAQTALAAQSK